jgi:hypothetical protein
MMTSGVRRQPCAGGREPVGDIRQHLGKYSVIDKPTYAPRIWPENAQLWPLISCIYPRARERPYCARRCLNLASLERAAMRGASRYLSAFELHGTGCRRPRLPHVSLCPHGPAIPCPPWVSEGCLPLSTWGEWRVVTFAKAFVTYRPPRQVPRVAACGSARGVRGGVRGGEP